MVGGVGRGPLLSPTPMSSFSGRVPPPVALAFGFCPCVGQQRPHLGNPGGAGSPPARWAAERHQGAGSSGEAELVGLLLVSAALHRPEPLRSQRVSAGSWQGQAVAPWTAAGEAASGVCSWPGSLGSSGRARRVEVCISALSPVSAALLAPPLFLTAPLLPGKSFPVSAQECTLQSGGLRGPESKALQAHQLGSNRSRAPCWPSDVGSGRGHEVTSHAGWASHASPGPQDPRTSAWAKYSLHFPRVARRPTASLPRASLVRAGHAKCRSKEGRGQRSPQRPLSLVSSSEWQGFSTLGCPACVGGSGKQLLEPGLATP